MIIPLATDFKTRTSAPDKDARQKNSYIEVKGEQTILRKRPSAQGGVSVGTGIAQGGIGLNINGVPYFIGFWADTMQPYSGGGTSWDSGTAYVVGDHVSFGFNDYWALEDNTGSQPPSDNWSPSHVPAVVSPYSWTLGGITIVPDSRGNGTCTAYGGGVYCFVKPRLQNSNGNSYTSSNGLAWTEHVLSDDFGLENIVSIVHNGTVFCVCFAKLTGEYVSSTSTDGIIWSAPSAFAEVAVDGVFSMIAVGSTIFSSDTIGSGVYKSTNNGVTWSYTAFPVSWNNYGLAPIVWNGVVLCVVNANINSNKAFTSSDNGATWVQRTLPESIYFTSIAAVGTIICAVNGTKIGRSIDNGASWTITSHSYAGKISSNNSIFLIYSGSNTSVYYSSVDGLTWIERTMPSAKEWLLSTYANSKFIAFDNGATSCATSLTGL